MPAHTSEATVVLASAVDARYQIGDVDGSLSDGAAQYPSSYVGGPYYSYYRTMATLLGGTPSAAASIKGTSDVGGVHTLYIFKCDSTFALTLTHNSGTANAPFFLTSEADETIPTGSLGGWVLTYGNGLWHSHTKPSSAT